MQASDRTQANASFDCFDNCGRLPSQYVVTPPTTPPPLPLLSQYLKCKWMTEESSLMH